MAAGVDYVSTFVHCPSPPPPFAHMHAPLPADLLANAALQRSSVACSTFDALRVSREHRLRHDAARTRQARAAAAACAAIDARALASVRAAVDGTSPRLVAPSSLATLPPPPLALKSFAERVPPELWRHASELLRRYGEPHGSGARGAGASCQSPQAASRVLPDDFSPAPPAAPAPCRRHFSGREEGSKFKI